MWWCLCIVPSFTSYGQSIVSASGLTYAGALSFDILEGETEVTTLATSGATIWALTSVISYDQGLFGVNSSTGLLSFTSAPDYENPQDVSGTPADNVHIVRVNISDGSGNSTVVDIAINVLDRWESSVNSCPSLINKNPGGQLNSSWVYASGYSGISTSTSASGYIEFLFSDIPAQSGLPRIENAFVNGVIDNFVEFDDPKIYAGNQSSNQYANSGKVRYVWHGQPNNNFSSANTFQVLFDNGNLVDFTSLNATCGYSSSGAAVNNISWTEGYSSSNAVCQGSAQTFSISSATANNGGTITYQWQKLNPTTNEFDDLTGYTTASLTFTTIYSSDVGTYRCMLIEVDSTPETIIAATSSEFTISNSDNIAPIAVAQDITVALDASGMASISTIDIDNGSSDNCNFALSLDITSFDCDDLGANTVVLTAIDSSGNTHSATATVTVVDNISPSLLSNDISLYLDSTGIVEFDTTAVYEAFNDNCDATFNFTPQVFDCGDVGAHLSSVSGTDEAGNTTSIDFIINVKDSLSPWISLFTDTVLLNASGQGTLDTAAVIDYIRDNCGIQTIVFSDLDFSASNLGLNTITVSVTDENNNQSVALTDIWVIDPLPPNVKAKDLVLPLDASGQADLTVSQVDNGSTDNIGFDTLYIDASGYDCSDLGDHWVVLTGVDRSGNSDTAWSKVTVVDNMKPDVDAVNTTVYLDSSGSATLSFQDVDNGSTDNCGIDTTYLSKETFGCGDVGTSSAIAYAKDSSGNRGSSVFLVTVVDTMAPSVAVFSDTVELGATGVGTLDTTAVLDYIRENCSVNSIGFSQLSYTVSDLGQNTLTVTVKDVHNNTTVVTTDIWVVDLIDPNVKANDVILPLNANGTATLTLAQVDDNSSDNAGLDSLYIDASGYDCSDLGDHWVVLTGVDVAGNSDTAWSKVTVVDQIYPTMSVSNAVLYLDSSSSAVLSYADVDNGTYDNCGIDTTYLSKELFSCSDRGSNPIIATAVDSSGNVSTQIVQVIVLDTLAPNFSLSVDTIQLYTTTSCQGVGSWTYTVGDNCSGVSVTSNYNTGSTFGVGTTKVLSTATDQSGNSTSDSLFVVVTDTLAPFWVNYPFVTQTIPSLTTCGSNVSWYPPTAIDYCGLVTITSNYNSGDFFTGPDTVVFTATDLSGNTITYSLPITISDVIPPVISPISDTTVYVDSNSCFATYIYPENIQMSDNCGIDTSYFVPSTGQMSVGVNAVTLYVMDLYGNVSTESYQVTVVDNIPPTLVSGPSDTTLGSCNSIFSFPSPVFTDNCGVQSVSLITGGNSGNQFATGTTVNTYVAYDAHGNTDTFSFSITVLPSTAPVLPSYGFVCDTDPDFDLTGGDTNFVFYGGSYIQNNMFSPTTSGPGLHNINYSYLDSTGCTTYGNFAMSVSVGPATPVIIRVTSTHLSTHQPYTSYQWFFNGNPIAGATSRTYQATVGGKYKVKVWNDGGCENISVPFFVGVVSTPEYTIHDLEIFPNPTTTDLVIDRKGYPMELDVELYSLTGKQLIESHYEGSEPVRLDMRNYPAGLYILKIHSDEGIVRNERIVIQH